MQNVQIDHYEVQIVKRGESNYGLFIRYEVRPTDPELSEFIKVYLAPEPVMNIGDDPLVDAMNTSILTAFQQMLDETLTGPAFMSAVLAAVEARHGIV